MKKVLVAFDGSVGSIKALNMGVKLVKNFGAELQFVYVAPMSDVYHYNLLGDAQFKETLESLKEEGKDFRDLINDRGKRALEMANTCLRESGVKAKEIVKIGQTAEEVVNTAREEGADMIVVGVNLPNPSLAGSVAQEIVENSPCSVLAVAPSWATLVTK